MTAVPSAPLAQDVEKLSVKLKALSRRLHEQGHPIGSLVHEDRSTVGGLLLKAFAASGELEVVELLHECCAPQLVELLRVTIVQENLPFSPADLLPDLMARLLRAAHGFNARESFDQLAGTLARSVVLDTQKSVSRSFVREQRAVEIEFPADANPLWEPPADAEDVRQGFASLAEGHRRCLVMRDREGLPYYDIGDQGGLEVNVATRIRRARERLHQLATHKSSGLPLLITKQNHGKRDLDANRP
jgi:DNA-directed RNA polymerase specialized sigma24 family protein